MNRTTLLALAATTFATTTLLACGDEDGDFSYEDFEGGNFQMTTTAVSDACYDGAFKTIFMPEGTANDWGLTTELPSWADLPATYEIQLQEPFAAMEVTVEAGTDGTMVVTDSAQVDVELDGDAYPGCYVDMVIDAEFTIVDADNIQGFATLNTSGFDEKGCPVVSADPCDITLDLTGTRAQ